MSDVDAGADAGAGAGAGVAAVTMHDAHTTSVADDAADASMENNDEVIDAGDDNAESDYGDADESEDVSDYEQPSKR
jgi:hypothetical protein